MHKLPSLPYEYNALDPYIDEETMKIHHTKHHQAYIDKLNTALEGVDEVLKEKTAEELLTDFNDLPENLKDAVLKHAGGHANHTLFWQVLKNVGDNNQPVDEIKEAIDKKFGSFEKFKKDFTDSALSVFGSGWAWLILDSSGQIIINTTPNQESPLIKGQKPILGLDVWEHAYYLKYQNKRAEYIENFFKIINWEKVNEIFNQK